MATDLAGLAAAAADWARTIHAARGFYLDARIGFLYGHRRVEQAVEQSRAADPSFDPEKVAFIYGTGPPEVGDFQHVVSQAEAMRRMADEGSNHAVLGHWFVVLVYQYWETRHRAVIASALGMKSSDLKVPIMGDLRQLRHAILKERGRITQAVSERLEVLTFIQPSETLTLSHLEIDRIADEITDAMHRVIEEV